MESVFKTVKFNRKEAQCVASYLKVSPGKVKDSDCEELLWEITRKSTKGLSKEGLRQVASAYQIDLTSESMSTIKMNIEQCLADKGMALVPKSLPSIKEIAEGRLKKVSSANVKASGHENRDSLKTELKLPEVRNLTVADARRFAQLLGIKGADLLNRSDCIACISKRAIQGLDVPELQALCEKAGLSDQMYETRKTELRYSLIEDASSRGIGILPCLDWAALENEYEYAEIQRKKIEEEKAGIAREKSRLKKEAEQAKKIAMQSARNESEELRKKKMCEREQARLLKKQQAQAKKNAKAMGKLVGGLLGGLGGGIGALFKESKSQKAHRKWMKRSTNTFNTK